MGSNVRSIAESRDRLRMRVHKLSIEFFDLLAVLPLCSVQGLRWDLPTGGLDMMPIHNCAVAAANFCGRRGRGVFWPSPRGQTHE